MNATKEKYQKEFKKLWLKWLVDIDCKEVDIAKDNGMAQQNLNRKINQGTLSVPAFLSILDKKGYKLEILHK